MLLKLFLLFTTIPIIEVYILIYIGGEIGFMNTILIVILTGIAGATFAKTQGLLVLQKIKSQLDRGEMPGNELTEGFLILIGGVMLITPGILTDIFGLSLIFPFTRVFYAKFIIKYFKNRTEIHNIQFDEYGNGIDNNIIDVKSEDDV